MPEAVGQVDELVEVVMEHARPLADVAEEAVALDDLDLELADLGLPRRARCGLLQSARAAACRRRCRAPAGRSR